MKNTCIYCGTFIVRSSAMDPYICIDCGNIMDRKEERLLELN